MTADQHPPAESNPASAIQTILESLNGLRFGSVETTVHEGRTVQSGRKEKSRLSIPCHIPGDGRSLR